LLFLNIRKTQAAKWYRDKKS